jgi:L-ribulokinase
MISEAAQKRPGESGLIALDWWNGNRNILNDSDLSGVVLGMNLRTRPHDVLRALIEATAFATRVIFENFEKHGIRSESLVAAGGMARKDPFMMQIYADVLRMRIEVVSSANLPSLASAIYSSVAAGVYPDIYAASDALASKVCRTYEPNEENSAIYDRLYAEYLTLHDYFGRGENNVMKRLRALAAEVKES